MGRCDSRRLARVARSSLGSVVSLGPGWGAFRGPFPSPLPPLALVLLCRSPSPPAVGSPRSADPAALPDPPFGGMAGHARARASAAVRDPLGRRVSSWRSPRLRGLRGRRGVFFGGLCVREGTARVGPCEGKRLLAVVRRPVGVRSGLAEVRLGARSAPSSSGKTFCGDRRRAGVGARRCDNPRVFLVSAAGAPFDVSPLSPRPWPGLRPRFRRRPPSRPSRASRPCVLPSAFPPSFALAARDFKAAPRSSASRRAVRRPFSRRPRWRGLAPASSRSLDPARRVQGFPSSPALRLAAVLGGLARCGPHTRLHELRPWPPAWFRDVVSRHGVSRREVCPSRGGWMPRAVGSRRGGLSRSRPTPPPCLSLRPAAPARVLPYGGGLLGEIVAPADSRRRSSSLSPLQTRALSGPVCLATALPTPAALGVWVGGGGGGGGGWVCWKDVGERKGEKGAREVCRVVARLVG